MEEILMELKKLFKIEKMIICKLFLYRRKCAFDNKIQKE